MRRLHPNEIAFLAGLQWTGEDQVIAVAVAMAESKGDPEALGMVTGTDGVYAENVDCGLWQISNRWHSAKLVAAEDWSDPFENARLAKMVWDEFLRAGKVPWSAWAVFNSGSYLKFMPMARLAVKAPFEPPASFNINAIADRMKETS